MGYDKSSFEQLKADAIGLGLTEAEERTLKWISGWDKSTVDHVVSIIMKAREALQ